MLREKGINPTRQRIELAFALFSRMEHLSADQILAIVNERNPEVSKATVYNTLRLFVEYGLVKALVIDPARIFYDPNVAPHYHMYDVVTGELTDVPAGSIRVSGLPQLPPGVVAEGVDVVVRTRRAG